MYNVSNIYVGMFVSAHVYIYIYTYIVCVLKLDSYLGSRCSKSGAVSKNLVMFFSYQQGIAGLRATILSVSSLFVEVNNDNNDDDDNDDDDDDNKT